MLLNEEINLVAIPSKTLTQRLENSCSVMHEHCLTK